MAKSNTGSKSEAYLALVDTYADRNPHWTRSASQVSIDAEDVHTVLCCHPDIAQATLGGKHLAAHIVDELNSVYEADTEDARLAFLVRTYLKAAAEAQVFEDIRDEVQRREELPCETPDMPATESRWPVALPEMFL